MQKITTFLWFDHEAEEAANFYVSVFTDKPGATAGSSKITEISRYGEAGPGEAGSVMTVSFQLEGQEFIALNAGPEYSFTEAISLYVNCESQEEIDDLWAKLTDGGKEVACGWLNDRYGLIDYQTMFASLAESPEPREGMQAFMEKRKPNWVPAQFTDDGSR